MIHTCSSFISAVPWMFCNNLFNRIGSLPYSYAFVAAALLMVKPLFSHDDEVK
jgi:hypothetical protein